MPPGMHNLNIWAMSMAKGSQGCAESKEGTRALFMNKVVEPKIVQHENLGCFQLSPDIQDHQGHSKAKVAK